MALHIEAEAEAALRRFAAAGYPDEACGVLIGTAAQEAVSVVSVTLGRNLRADRVRDRYELDPGAIVAAERSARAHDMDIVGFWHSHPDHPARPSDFDTERAWPDYVYVIVSTSSLGSGDLRAWVLDEASGRFAAAALTSTGARRR